MWMLSCRMPVSSTNCVLTATCCIPPCATDYPQALLDATALATGRLKTEVVCDEWQLPRVAESIPLFGQSGDDRYIAVDKMILKGIDVLPHALINNVEEKLGFKGEKLREYVRWLSGIVF